MIHFYCLAVEAGFYSDVVECLPVDPATWVRFPAGAGKIFSLYDNSLGHTSYFREKNVYLYILIDFVLVNFRHIKYVPDFRARIIMS